MARAREEPEPVIRDNRRVDPLTGEVRDRRGSRPAAVQPLSGPGGTPRPIRRTRTTPRSR